MYFARNMGKNGGKNMSKILSIKYSEKLLDHAKQSATNALEAYSNRVIQKIAKETRDLTGNKIADKIVGVSRNT